ncbi:MAG: GNAT family N-acetyltransferase [Rhodobacteraceae bacterium]|nr:GNAT family N-acetyltransferase [Paracoccaceae bacterium]
MLIRQTTHADSDEVTAIFQASYPKLMPAGYAPDLLEVVLPAMTIAKPALLSSGSYFVALAEDNAYAGCGGWTKERPGTGEKREGLGHIRHFATHPDYVGKGVGRAIYLACEALARSEGVTKFECYASLNAEGFYRSLGFELVERIDVPMGEGLVFPSLRMMRAI